MWTLINAVFDCLPFTAIIEDKILCVHGGLSPELSSLEQLKNIRRPTQVTESGLICDLIWADPEEGQRGWGESERGISFTFGEDVLAKFLQRTDLDLVCRAHQVVEDGYEFFVRTSDTSRGSCFPTSGAACSQCVHTCRDIAP